ncbi:MAG: hypothetical protein C4519_00705 [Desulfobacteraceae bacterium]|nr:MAG: hypothetical protein C4519_00705 [Desulfobacteraceae bacterium]
MKKKISSCIIIFFLINGIGFADIGSDKYMHTSACAAISATADTALAQIWPDLPQVYRIMAAVTAAMLVGLGKELIDQKIDNQDLVADFAGALVGVSFKIEW